MAPLPDELTEEEHQARAMLLGFRHYMAEADYYWNRVDSNGSCDTRIDATTLEPITYKEAERRINAARERAKKGRI